MAQQEGYIRWPSNTKIPLMLALVDSNGDGITGATPEVSIRRYRETFGVPLDLQFWDGVDDFTATPTWHPMPAVDNAENPGLYSYLWEQDKTGLEWLYLIYYRYTGLFNNWAAELHLITNEVYIPHTQPDPITIGPQTIMGQLELVKDGGTGQFDPLADSLHFLHLETKRILGLLHYNAMVDKHVYDINNQLISARVRVFEDETKVPADKNGNETAGLIQEYVVEAEYGGVGVLLKYSLKRVL